MEINNFIEHTLLKPDATLTDIERLISEAVENKFFGICINTNYVSFAKEFLKEFNTKIVTVVNFPLANNSIYATQLQTQFALDDGADEIDMVMNIAEFKNKNYTKVESDIRKIKSVCSDNILKVILETDLLSRDETITATKCAVAGGANYVKTSTGFIKNGIGATVENIELMFEIASKEGVLVKASGGIKDYQKALDLINAGATRLGTSSGVEIVLGEVKNV